MMSLPDNSRIELCQLVGPANVLTAKEDLIPYSFDGTAALQQMPACVVFARSTAEVSGVLKFANDSRTPVPANTGEPRARFCSGHDRCLAAIDSARSAL